MTTIDFSKGLRIVADDGLGGEEVLFLGAAGADGIRGVGTADDRLTFNRCRLLGANQADGPWGEEIECAGEIRVGRGLVLEVLELETSGHHYWTFPVRSVEQSRLTIMSSSAMLVALGNETLLLADLAAEDTLFAFSAGYPALMQRLRDRQQLKYTWEDWAVARRLETATALREILERAARDDRLVDSLGNAPGGFNRSHVLFERHGLPAFELADDVYSVEAAAVALQSVHPSMRVFALAQEWRYV